MKQGRSQMTVRAAKGPAGGREVNNPVTMAAAAKGNLTVFIHSSFPSPRPILTHLLLFLMLFMF